ncbi:DUF2752 domain-containing protein [Micromonospora sp. CPCC 206061]|uniref:DUF2752 domain-containing protein n=1 Tax=Micromonospora sp. CPCC 206061 TaxID=3122410 RepID=UPI002FF41FD7
MEDLVGAVPGHRPVREGQRVRVAEAKLRLGPAIADPAGRCLFHAVFGIAGPTCGITRTTWYLLHGNVVDAARMHLAALLLRNLPWEPFTWFFVPEATTE